MLRSLIRDDNAVNIEIGYILNLVVLMIVTGTIAGAFYLRAEDSSQRAMRAGFADLGSEIARDITNMYLASEYSDNINLTVTHDIPLTIGGKGYSIELKNAGSTPDHIASVNINETGSPEYEIITWIDSIDSSSNVNVICSGTNGAVVYSGSGEIKINMTKKNTGVRDLCIK